MIREIQMKWVHEPEEELEEKCNKGQKGALRISGKASA